MNKIIIANWKANPVTLEEALDLLDFYLAEIQKYQNIQLVICPPIIYLEECVKKLQTTDHKLQISLGVQDIFWEKSGPYTGEVSTDMLKNFGVTHALVGHSDRRYKIGEDDQVINKKIKAVLSAGITPVLLVGEQNITGNRQEILEKQLSADLAGVTADEVTKVLIAYEPVWAISTTVGGEPDTPTNTLEAIKIIQKFITNKYGLKPIACLYGGSVNTANVVDFLSYPEISGTVIGGASLRKEEFVEILSLSNEIH